MSSESRINQEFISEVTTEQERTGFIESYIERIAENPVELGRGRTAVVRTVQEPESQQSICIKEITNPESEFYINNVEQELKFQTVAYQAGVRVPRPFLSATTENGRAYLAMETIIGHSIEEIVKQNIELPPSFEYDTFCQKTELLFRKLRNNGMQHRDVHIGNIMIEWETGEPVLIDFGTAAIPFDEDSNREPTGIPGQFRVIRQDLASWAECKKILMKHLTKV